MRYEKSHLGKGMAFPLQMNAKREFALVEADKDIEQSIMIILSTRPGERVMRPTFGCRAHELLFEMRDAATLNLLRKYVEDALAFWEPRIQVISVTTAINTGDEGAVFVDIEYRIKETHDVRSIVFPFYLAGEEDW